ncbi:Uma2 family endonuclease [Gloeobacter kilaueensis]|uniref:Uma2 family endonuclease n=1 Tax=Gloeobacter kilaueensis TaxID=1416614 RepID=UPI001CB72095|nr:Uma2 family endonuclease [Gloeobacter kilaueensis]
MPDGFLSLEVERVFDEDLRLSYVLWEELKVPTLVLKVVSKTRNKEYRQKKALYAELGVPYYVIYAPRRRRKEHLEIYRLVEEPYVLLPGQPAWIEELGLGIGRERGTYEGVTREWLYWYDRDGKRYATPEERLAQAEEQVERNRERIRALEQKLRESGIEP